MTPTTLKIIYSAIFLIALYFFIRYIILDKAGKRAREELENED